MNNKSLSCASVIALCTAVAAPGAFAQATGAGENIPEEIVVTAQRRAERIQDVPVAITAFSASEIDNAAIERLSDVAAYTPGLELRGMQSIERGYASQILVSQDVCTKFQLRKHGGFGYDFVLTNFIPYARAEGVGERNILQVTQRNPARVLTFDRPRQLD